MQLYNKLSAKERAKLIDEAGEKPITVSFYHYFHIGNPLLFRNFLFIDWDKMDVLGRTYVAKEGINAQISVPTKQFEAFKEHLYSIEDLDGIRLNVAIEQNDKSFLKLKVKVRKKIVADGLEDDSFDVTNKGIHLKSQDFNNILEDENTVLVDMRNHYESEIARLDVCQMPFF